MAQTPWQDLIPYYVARSLPAPQMQAFEAQLARDNDLRQDVDEWRRIAAVVWREGDAAARHLPPLSPEIYKQLQYRNGAQPMTSTVPLPAPRVRQISMGRMNGSPLMFVAGFLVVFLCGGIFLMSAMRRLQPEVLTTAVANSTDQGGFGGPMSLSTATPCAMPFGENVPGCLTATPSYTPTDSTWTPNPRATSTPVIVRPLATLTPRLPLKPTITPIGLMARSTINPFMYSLTLTTIAVYGTTTPWPDYQCVATNTSGDVLPLYARAEGSEAVDYWAPGASLPVSTSMYGYWIQLGYGKWSSTNGVTLSGPCDSLPQPTATIYFEVTATDQCTVTNTTQSQVPLYASADAQAQIVNYLPIGAIDWVIAQSSNGWYELYFTGQLGWLRPEGLTFQGNCSFVPLATSTSLPTLTWTPGPTSVPLQTVFNPPLRAVPVMQTVFYTVPDTGSAILQTVDGGTEWNTVGIAVINGTEWVSVFTWEGKQGWIQRSMVNIVDPTVPTATSGS